MQYSTPFTVFPGIVQRSPRWIDLMVRNLPGVNANRLWGAKTLDDSYGTITNSGIAGNGGRNFAEVSKGLSYMSPTLARNGPGCEESHRGMSRFYFDPEDFVDPLAPVPMPSDDETLFVRMQQSLASTGGYLAVPGAAVLNPTMPIRGPILVIPPFAFWTYDKPALSIAGTAPAGTSCTVGNNPVIDETMQIPPPMHFVLPRPASLITVTSMTAAETILVSPGLGIPMVEVNETNPANFEGNIREIVIARKSGVGGVRFSVFAAIALASG